MSFLPLVATLYLSNETHVSAVVCGSGDATMELGVNVACVMHASLMWVMSSGDQSGWGEETLSRVTFEREGTRMMLQQVTIEEHQVKNLVFILLQLFIHIAEGHIDLVIVQRRGMDDES
jgi:hypothetical protein